MTLYLPLRPSSPLPPSPSFLLPSQDPAAHLSNAIQAILKARRIVVICGAGISVQAGIPDFRSADGLFQSIKRDNPKEAMSSGKELFDVSVFNSEQKTSLFCQMIAQLSDLSQAAEPTSFHHVLRALDDSGKLLRVYTQNIDAIEQKSGLSFGVPEYEGRRSKSRSKKSSSVIVDEAMAVQQDDNNNNSNNNDTANDTTTTTGASTSRLPSPPAETPRCIPLHGTLQSMHCQICNHTFPLLPYLPSLTSGVPPPCPECTSLEATRQLVGKRPRGIGRLRPSVVLYNEMHKDGEGVGEVVRKDLMGSSKGKGRSGADLLLVVGTSLRVPGTKRMVREFAKAVRSRGVAGMKEEQGTANGNGSNTRNGSGLATPAPSPRRSPAADEESQPQPTSAKGMKAVYLNLDFPVPTREWEGVFDAWIQGDAQEFAEVLRKEIGKEKERKEGVEERKREKRREKEREMREDGGVDKDELPDLGRMEKEREKEKAKQKDRPKSMNTPTSTKRKHGASSSSQGVHTSSMPSTSTTPSPSSAGKKRRKPTVTLPISPPRTPLVRGRGRGAVSGSGSGSGSGGSGSGGCDEDAEPSRTPTPTPTLTRKGKGKEPELELEPECEHSSESASSSSKLFVRIPGRSHPHDKTSGKSTEKDKEKDKRKEKGKEKGTEKEKEKRKGKTHWIPEVYIKTKPPLYVRPYEYEVPQYQYQHQHPHQHQHQYQYQHPYQHQYQYQHPHPQYARPYETTMTMTPLGARMDVDPNDVGMDVDIDVDVVGNLDGNIDMGRRDVDVDVDMDMEEEKEVEVDIMNDWHYYDDVQYAPSLRYSQTRGRRSVSPLQSRPCGGGGALSLSLSSSLSLSLSSSSSSSSSSAASPSRAHPPLRSPRLSAHSSLPLPLPLLPGAGAGTGVRPPLSLLSSPPRLNDHHRLGGRIEHSRTHLASHMARTLQSGIRDSVHG